MTGPPMAPFLHYLGLLSPAFRYVSAQATSVGDELWIYSSGVLIVVLRLHHPNCIG